MNAEIAPSQVFPRAAAPARASAPAALFISYNGLLDPLGKSQILAYVERLNRDYRMHVLSYERPEKLADAAALRAMEARLRDLDVGWIRLTYHRRPSLPATTYDMLSGVVAVRRLMLREKLGLLHARGYVPMEIASNATRSVPTLFDIRGLQPEEYVDGGVWKKGELKWRLAKRSEARFFRRAHGAVVLTHAIRPHVRARFGELGRDVPIEVVPCCVDLGEFQLRADARRTIRVELGVDDDTVVFAYAGSLSTWYMPDEMARFVRAFAEKTGRRAFFLWMVNNDAPLARAASAKAGLASDAYRVVSSPPSRVGEYLSAADVGLALIRPCFSKRASSPTKYAEYLATGLPLVMCKNVGDSAVIAREGGAVALPDVVDDAALARAVTELQALLPRGRAHFRAIAERLFDVDDVALPAYRRLYAALLGR